MPNTSNINTFRQENSSGSGQRSRTIDYKPLADFNSGSCMVYTIDIPDVQNTDIVPVFNTKSKTMQYFHTTEKREIVTFKVCYTPFKNSNGKKLLTSVKKIVDSVLTKNFKPEPVTINILRNGNIERTIRVDDTVVVEGKIIVDLHDFVRIEFTLSGILADS